MCRISPRFDLASGAKSNLGKYGACVRREVESRKNARARVGCEVESRENAGLASGAKVESRGNAGPRVGREGRILEKYGIVIMK